jgi:DNA-binding FadR family transcriptional regulator
VSSSGIRSAALHFGVRAPKRSAYSMVLRGIGRGIVAGEFPVGGVLPRKEELMQRFGVSNASLREALKALEAKGMVAARTKVGYWVTEESGWDLLDGDFLDWRLEVGVDTRFIGRLFELRQAIEPVAAALAALRRSDDQGARLDALAQVMANPDFDQQRFTDVDVAFHILILEASGNPMMQSIGGLIRTALAASFSLSAPTTGLAMIRQAHRQHAALADCIRNREPQAAADAMIVVINQGWSNFCSEVTPIISTVAIRRFEEVP